MKDIDFDELDRAVNSVMNSVTVKQFDTQPSLSNSTSTSIRQESSFAINEKTPVEVISTTPQIISEDVKKEEATTLAQETSRYSSSSAAATPRRTGRYMDMVPPRNQSLRPTLRSHGPTDIDASTDEVSANDTSLNAMASGPVIQDIAPVGETIADKASSTEPVVTKQTEELRDTNTVAPELELDKELNDQLQEILDISTTDPKQETEKANKEEAKDSFSAKLSSDETPVENALDDATNKKEDSDLSTETDEPFSPFIPDAKVEKRPLGGALPEVSEEVEAIDDPTEPHNVAAESAPEETIDDNGVVKQESVDVGAAPVLTAPEFHEELLAVERDAEPLKSPALESIPEPTVETIRPTTPISPPSIPQQYKEKQSSGDQSHAPIYDTNVQPLTHPAPKKSGWGTVLIILVVILVCVAGAAGLYFSGIIL